MIKLVSSQGCRKGSTYANYKCNTTYYRSKDKKHMIISKDTEKAFDKFNILS
jgi:hypothetical protein